MNKPTRRAPASKKAPLPFEEWMQRRYPENTQGRQLLSMLGILDLMYVLYRAGFLPHKEEEPSHEIAPIRRAIRKTAKVPKPEDDVPAPKRRTRKPVRRAGSRKKTAELTLEFEPEETKPLDIPAHEEKPTEPEPTPEPEPLVIEDNSPAASTPNGNAIWLGAESLEDNDPRAGDLILGVGGIAVGFDNRNIDGDDETLLTVDDVAYRVRMTNPSINLGQMAQIMRVTYGELYVLGRAALGALSGEGYISADEAERVVRALKAAGKQATELDVAYFTKDAKSRNRTSSVLRVRFEPA